MTISISRLSLSVPEQLEQLPYPVYFVCKNVARWQELMASDRLPEDLEPWFERSLSTSDIWSAQPYMSLRQRGLDVHLVPDYMPGQICIIPSDDLRSEDRAFNSYVVACQYDRARPELCEQRLVINELNILNDTDHYLSHWPQPNLLPRNPQRGTRVENLVFKGMERNLAYPFRRPEFAESLQQLGIRFVVSPDDSATQFQDWADYTQADVVLAVRNNTTYDLTVKPALKLINAWLSGCPAILGPEPAYQAIRQSELDYIEVRSVEEVIDALKRLQNDPDLYDAMVENGFKRVQDFNADRVALQWRNVLAGPIAQGYERWCKQSPLQQKIGRPIQFLLRRRRHSRSFAYHMHHIHQGERLFGDEPTLP